VKILCAKLYYTLKDKPNLSFIVFHTSFTEDIKQHCVNAVMQCTVNATTNLALCESRSGHPFLLCDAVISGTAKCSIVGSAGNKHVWGVREHTSSTYCNM